MSRIKIADSNDQKRWNSFVLAHEKAGPYHLYAWKRAIERIYHHKACYLICEGEKREICGVLPLIFVKPPFMQGTLVSLPFCDYGGALTYHNDVGKELLDYAFELAQVFKANIEFRNIYQETILTSLYQLEAVSHKARMVLELPETPEILWDGFKSKLRSQIKRPLKDGLIFKLGSLELINDFYTVFRINMRDLGSPVHSKEWMASVLEAYGMYGHVGVVYKDKIPLAAGIIIGCRETVSMPWASALSEFNKLSPNMLLYWGFLKFACENGFKRFDFGRSTPGEGTYKFKEQWGATPYPLYWYGYGSLDKNQPLAAGKMRYILEQIWSKLPGRFVDTLGPFLRKYITL